jgi:hypothetical protein
MPATSNLIGRDDELAGLVELIDGAWSGGGAIVVVGDAGVGKSALLRVASEHAVQLGMQVLETTGVESEAEVPFAGLEHLLRPVLCSADSLQPSQRDALAAAVGTGEGPTPEPFIVALAALNLLSEAAASKPVLVAVDDVQWLDRPTHEALAFIARRVGRDQVVVIATVRPGHSGPFLTAGLTEIELQALSDDASRAVLARYGSDLRRDDRERILQAAAGNPLALVELPAAWRRSRGLDPHDQLPLTARLERTFAGRLADLPRSTRDVVLVAAVDDREDVSEILSAASVLVGEPVRVDALEAAAAAGLLQFDQMRVRFRHPLVRSGVVQSETVSRRQAASAALASVLGGEPHRRTWHRAQAVVGPDEDLADELEGSQVMALRRGSVTAAIWALERAAQLTTDPAKKTRRLLLAAEHAFGLGRADMVDRLLSLASDSPLSELDQARMEWLREIFNDGVPGDATRVFELCDIASRAAAAGDKDLALNLLLASSLRCWWADTGPAARARVVDETERLERAIDDPRYVAILGTAEPVLRGAAVTDRLSQFGIEAISDADELRLLGQAAHAIGDPVRSVDLLDRSERRLREQGRLGLLSQVLTMQILDRIELGDWARAAANAEEGQQLAHDTGQPIWDAGSAVVASVLHGLRGDNEKAQTLASEAEHYLEGRRFNNLLACVQLARGYGWIGSGHYSEAYQALRPLFDPHAPCFHLTERFHGLMLLAEAALHTGQVDDARQVVQDMEHQAAVTPSTTLKLHLHYSRAVLADDDAAEELFIEGLGQDLVRWPWPRARLELAYGSWLRRQRRAAESRTHL